MIKFSTINGHITEASDGNMAYHAGDTTKTAQNRENIKLKLNVKELFFPNQIHSSIILRVKEGSAIKDADAVISNDKRIALGVVVADCVPILLYDPVQKAIGAVHAGWRGTAEDIATKTVFAMNEKFGSSASDIIAGIGPSIKRCCYEVGNEVAQALGLEPKRQKVDLQELNAKRLKKMGITSIETLECCTFCDDRFFSYRQNNSCGRFAAIIRI